MQDAGDPNATMLLTRVSQGDAAAGERLFPLVYSELRRLAQHFMVSERADHTLSATALVHEVYLKLIVQKSARWQDKAHFLAVAAQAMRRVLVDHARGHAREVEIVPARTGGRSTLDLTRSAVLARTPNEDLLALDEALKKLEGLDPRQAKIVECFYFGGLSVDQTAEVVGVSARTVDDELSHARAWLKKRLDRT